MPRGSPPQTVKTYGDGVRAYLRFCEETGRPAKLDRAILREFIDQMLVAGAKPATATSRHLAVRRFSAWLAAEGEQASDPLLGIKAPKIDQPLVEPLSDDELKALIKACKGPDMMDRRDEALVRLMFTTGARAGEVADMKLSNVNLKSDPATVIIERGKGGKGRMIPLAVEVASALDRYLRSRKGHRLASTDDLWLGDRGKTFGYDALHKTLADRAQTAGIAGFYPHRLRHTAAHRWLERGGSEGGLMAVAGWTRPEMLMRYTRARASQRAAEEAMRLDLGAL